LDGPALFVVGSALTAEGVEGEEARCGVIRAVAGEDANIHAIGLHRRSRSDRSALVVGNDDLGLGSRLVARLDLNKFFIAAKHFPGERKRFLIHINAVLGADEEVAFLGLTAPDAGDDADGVGVLFAVASRLEK